MGYYKYRFIPARGKQSGQVCSWIICTYRSDSCSHGTFIQMGPDGVRLFPLRGHVMQFYTNWPVLPTVLLRATGEICEVEEQARTKVLPI